LSHEDDWSASNALTYFVATVVAAPAEEAIAAAAPAVEAIVVVAPAEEAVADVTPVEDAVVITAVVATPVDDVTVEDVAVVVADVEDKAAEFREFRADVAPLPVLKAESAANSTMFVVSSSISLPMTISSFAGALLLDFLTVETRV